MRIMMTMIVLFTELAFNDADEVSKAQRLEDIVTMMYSLPYVDGIIFWGFWDGKIWETDAPLYTGENVTVCR